MPYGPFPSDNINTWRTQCSKNHNRTAMNRYLFAGRYGSHSGIHLDWPCRPEMQVLGLSRPVIDPTKCVSRPDTSEIMVHRIISYWFISKNLKAREVGISATNLSALSVHRLDSNIDDTSNGIVDVPALCNGHEQCYGCDWTKISVAGPRLISIFDQWCSGGAGNAAPFQGESRRHSHEKPRAEAAR